MTSSWFFLSTLNYDARSTTHHPLLFSDLMKFKFSQQFFEKNPKISNFTKIRSVAAEFFHSDRQAEGQANITKARVPRPLSPAPGPDTLASNSLVPVHAMTTYQGTRTAISILKTSVSNAVDWPASRPG